jgi:DNA-binding FrmR family transcriptional regulator
MEENEGKIEFYKDKHLPHEVKENLIIRINRAKGHLESIKEMISQDRTCEEIITQLSAVKSAVNEIMIKVVEAHIGMIEKGNFNNSDVIELVKVLIKSMKLK